MDNSKREQVLAAIKDVEDEYSVHITYGKAINGKVYLVARGKEGVGFTAYSLSELRQIIEHYRGRKSKRGSSLDDED